MPRRRSAAAGCGGYSLVELLVVLALILAMSALAVPQAAAGLDRSRTRAAVLHVAGRMAFARAQAIRRSASVAIRFGEESDGFVMALFADGTGNGVRNAEIASGADPSLGSAERLSDLYPGAHIGISDPRAGSNPVRFGTSRLLVFTPVGTASSGSVYVSGRDRTQYVVRVAGLTARVSVLRLDPGTGEWLPL
ncbi:MAG: prepilin-type N-terminal cleavage/methylation domain-containing protein [Acidimicrobiia bacterium]|nr:prepilin-type N-terminal cleavage/methylation domain-containing protein [Acidimicrobiia bacterium]